MILQFKVKNFRSYRDEIVFSMEPNSSEAKAFNYHQFATANNQIVDVLKVAMIYGGNASGKTNVIRAIYELIYLIHNKPKVNQNLRINDSFKFDDSTLDEPSEFDLTFIGPDNLKYHYFVKISENIIKEEELNYYPNGKITNIFTREKYNPLNTVQIGVLGNSFGKRKTINVFENQLLISKFGDDEPHELISRIYQYFSSINIINATNEKHLESIERDTSKNLLENEELFFKVKRLIKWADTKIDDIEIVKQIYDRKGNRIDEEPRNRLTGPNPFDVFGIHKRYNNNSIVGEHSLEFRNWSHGTQSLYKLGGEIINVLEIGGTLIIDELDTSLHPFLTKMIVMLFQSNKINIHGAQLIFTTHDVTLLDRDLIRRDQVWIAQKSEQGATDLYSLQDFDDVREDTPFEKWYLAGKFGGLPKINSIDTIFDK
jgi:AAA15 family ATPase/GTPase